MKDFETLDTCQYGADIITQPLWPVVTCPLSMRCLPWYLAMATTPDITCPANTCPWCGCMVSVKLAKGGQYPGHHYMHVHYVQYLSSWLSLTCPQCLSCKNHYVFPVNASAPSSDIVLPTQYSWASRAMKRCAQLSCPKTPHCSYHRLWELYFSF